MLDFFQDIDEMRMLITILCKASVPSTMVATDLDSSVERAKYAPGHRNR